VGKARVKRIETTPSRFIVAGVSIDRYNEYLHRVRGPVPRRVPLDVDHSLWRSMRDASTTSHATLIEAPSMDPRSC